MTEQFEGSSTPANMGRRHRPRRTVLYGPTAVGKTSFAATAPKPYFLETPGVYGLRGLNGSGRGPVIPSTRVSTWDGLIAAIDSPGGAPEAAGTLVIDTLRGAW